MRLVRQLDARGEGSSLRFNRKKIPRLRVRLTKKHMLAVREFPPCG